MPNSTPVSDGQTLLAAHYNNLRLDIFDTSTGHNHDGTSAGGRKVAHSDLVTPGVNSHTVIDAHLAADSAHGIDAAAQLVGGLNTDQLVMCVGTLSTPASVSGYKCYFTDDGTNVSPAIFTTIKAILLTIQGNTGDASHHNAIVGWVTAYPSSGYFEYDIDNPGSAAAGGMSFVAIGTK